MGLKFDDEFVVAEKAMELKSDQNGIEIFMCIFFPDFFYEG